MSTNIFIVQRQHFADKKWSTVHTVVKSTVVGVRDYIKSETGRDKEWGGLLSRRSVGPVRFRVRAATVTGEEIIEVDERSSKS